MKYAKIFSGIALSALMTLCTACGSDNAANTKAVNEAQNDSVITDMSPVNDFEVWAQDSEYFNSQEDTAKVTAKTNSSKSKKTDSKTTAKSDGSAVSGKNSTSADSKSASKNSGSAAGQSGNKTTAKTTAKKTNGGGNKSTTAATKKTAKKTTEATTKAPEPTEADDTIHIKLNGSSVTSSSNKGVSINGSKVTLSEEGKYEFSGTLDNGQIIVNADKSSKIDIYFNGVSISCQGSAPLYVMSADTCSLHLADGTSNFVQDTASNSLSACIYSKDDLTIKGSGTLSVSGNNKHAIKSSNDVKVKNGTLYLSCPSTGIYGDDSVQISGGTIMISSCKDGIKAANETDSSRGYVLVEAGYVDVQNAAGNGIQAITGVTISGGTVNVHSEKKSVNCDNQSITPGCLVEY